MPHFEHAKVGLIVEDGISSAEVGRILLREKPKLIVSQFF